MVILRFLGALVLAFLVAILVRLVPTTCFAVIAHIITDFSVKDLIIVMFLSGIFFSIVGFVGQLLFIGQVALVRGNKVIGTIISLLYLDFLVGDYQFFFSEGSNGPVNLEMVLMLKEFAGSGYTVGAVISFLAMAAAYIFFSIPMFFKVDD